MARPLDYSKWKDIEISDDEDDTHPNVDTPSLFRWRHQARLEKMATKRQERDEIELGKTDTQRKLGEAQRKLADCSLDDETKEKLAGEIKELEKQNKEYQEKEQQLATKEKHEPWNVDTIGHDAFNKTRITKPEQNKPKPALSEDEESKLMRKFFDKNEDLIKKFGALKGFDQSQKFLLEFPHLCSDFTANYLTLDCLNAGIEEKEELVDHLARQCVTMQYLLELSKQLKANPESPNMIESFFTKISKADPQYLHMFSSEVDAFKYRIHKRAKDKRDAAVAEYEAEEKAKRIAESPGGLDPVEVFESLPQVMQDAFNSQDVGALQQVAASMNTGEFKEHLARCVASGLWVPDANKPKDEL